MTMLNAFHKKFVEATRKGDRRKAQWFSVLSMLLSADFENLQNAWVMFDSCLLHKLAPNTIQISTHMNFM